MKMSLAAGAVVALLSITPALAAGTAMSPGMKGPMSSGAMQGQTMPAADPQSFTTQAAIGNSFEIQSSQLALQKTQDKQLLSFAKRMIHDHGQAAEQMKPAAAAQGVTIPASLDSTHMAMLQHLSSLSGKAFDTAYIDAQVMGHDQTVALFKSYIHAGKPGALRKFASKTLPTIEMHDRMIHKIAGK